MAEGSRLRVSIWLPSRSKGKPQAQAVLLISSNAATAELLAAAANKLRLKKKDVANARLFVVSSGAELPRDGDVAGRVQNDALVAITLGEAYVGARSSSTTADAAAVDVTEAGAAAGLPTRWLRWEPRELGGSLAVVEWSDARVMNATLGRLSTLLEHPTLCGAETGRVVSHEAQRSLGSSSYLGHNLYAPTLLEFERLAASSADDGASAAERAFLGLWRERGSPAVVISFVSGERETLRHELCHARYALDASYREAVCAAWADEGVAKLHRWMRDLGYHSSRCADEFGAYLLTEPAAFWRGRLRPAELSELRERLNRGWLGGGGVLPQPSPVAWAALDVDAAVPKVRVGMPSDAL